MTSIPAVLKQKYATHSRIKCAVYLVILGEDTGGLWVQSSSRSVCCCFFSHFATNSSVRIATLENLNNLLAVVHNPY